MEREALGLGRGEGEDGGKVAGDILVRDAMNPVTLRRQPGVALSVAGGDVGKSVDAAVDLDHQSEWMADKVHDDAANGSLLSPVARKLAQFPPQELFGVGHIRAQTPSTPYRRWLMPLPIKLH